MKKFRNILITIMAAALIIGGVAAFIILSGRTYYNPEGTVGNTAGNLMNGGLFAEHNGVIYFSNPYDSNHLYSMNSDCTNMKKLCNDTVSYINVCDNYIFYVRNNLDPDNAGMLFRGQLYGVIRARLNGKHRKVLATDVVSRMVLYDNTLIYGNYKDAKITTNYLSIDQKSNEVVRDTELPVYSLYNDRLYYSGTGSDHNVYAFDCALKTSSTVLEGNTYLASMVDGFIYYIDLANNYALTKYNPSTQETLVLHKGRCINYNVYEDVVFFQTEGSENALHRMNINGTDDVIITEGSTDTISCTSQYTFFTYFRQSILYRVPTHGSGPIEMMNFK